MADEKAQVVKVPQAKFVFGDERRGGYRVLYGPALPTGGRPQVGWINEDYVTLLEAELEKAFACE